MHDDYFLNYLDWFINLSNPLAMLAIRKIIGGAHLVQINLIVRIK